jgi:hypothetical protein
MKVIFTTTDISDKLEQVHNTPPHLNAKLVAQMQAGIAHFFFLKKDGSIREAYGTLNKDILGKILGPQEDKEQSEPVPNSDLTIQKYFDLEAMSFRSFTVANLVCLF